MGAEDFKNVIVEFYSVTGILMIILTGIFIKVIFPILDKKNSQKLEVLNEKVTNMENNFNDDINDLKKEIKSLIGKLDEYITVINTNNIKNLEENSSKNVIFENHEQRLKITEREIKELKAGK